TAAPGQAPQGALSGLLWPIRPHIVRPAWSPLVCCRMVQADRILRAVRTVSSRWRRRTDGSPGGHVRQRGVDSRCKGMGDRHLCSGGKAAAFRVRDGIFDGAAIAIAAVKSGAFGAPLRGFET